MSATMLLAVLVALTAFLALAALASAEPLTGPAGKYDPNGFADACHKSGGTPTEDVTDSGAVLVSYCTSDNGWENSCNWVAGTCTYTYVPEPTTGVVVRPPVGGGLLDDAPATQPSFSDVASPSTGGGFDRAP